VANFGQVSWFNGPNVPAGAWATIPGSTLPFTSSGGPLLISLDISFINGSHASCRPTIDNVWAGSFGGLPNPGDPFWQEGLTYSAGGVWHSWQKTRLYPGVPAGNHTLRVQCATDAGTLAVCAASSVACSVNFVELKQ
jgi:hypothetical protein